MSLEAIKQVTETEENIQTHKAAAEAEARQIVADAEKAGQALVKQIDFQYEDGEEGSAFLVTDVGTDPGERDRGRGGSGERPPAAAGGSPFEGDR